MRDDLPRLLSPPALPDGLPNPAHMGKATYLKGQYANWQSAFCVVDISNSSVQPYLIYVSQTGSFQFEGRSWEDGRMRKGSSK